METSGLPNEDDTLNNISLTHEELLKVTKSTLGELLKHDPIVHDLPSDVTTEEIEALTAVLYGQSMTVIVKRGDNDDIPVIVSFLILILDFRRIYWLYQIFGCRSNEKIQQSRI